MARPLHRAAAAACAALCFQTAIALGQTASRPDQREPERLVRQVEPQPLSFEENGGQADADVKFLTRSRGSTFLIANDGAIVSRPSAGGRESNLRLSFTGADPGTSLAAEELLPGKTYYATRDSRGALSGRSTWRRVRQRDLYPGIDLIYYANERQLEFDFIVDPHKDPNRIRLAFSGAGKMTLDRNGELVFRIDGEDVRLKKPVIYQERDGARREIAGGYRIVDAKSQVVGFRLGEYDKSRPLVIDPTIVFATYRGGSAHEQPRALKVNALGEVYLFADTGDPASLPSGHYTERVPLGQPQPGFTECFLTKIARDGRTALYTVIFEGAGCQAMELAPEGATAEAKVHLALGTANNYQRTITENAGGGLTVTPLQGAYDACQQGSCGGVEWMRADAGGNVYFIMQTDVYELRKVDRQGQLAGAIPLIRPPVYQENGQSRLWDQITGFDVDDSGNVYIVGYGATPGIITPTANAFQPLRPSGDVCTDPSRVPCFDGFVIKVDTVSDETFRVAYASYLGGNDDDERLALVWDRSSRSIYITGTTLSPNFPVTAGTYSTAPPSPAGLTATFLVKLNLDAQTPANQLVFGTFLGTAETSASAVAILPGGLLAVAGQEWERGCTGSNCFPLVNSLYPRRSQFRPYPFLSVFSADGTSLLFSTLLDSAATADSWLTTLATNGSSTIYAGMTTNDATLATAGALQTAPTGEMDALVQAIDLSDIVSNGNPPHITLSPATINVSIITPGTGAIVPLVCGRLFTCALDDPDGDLLTHLMWSGPNGFRLSSPGVLPAPATQAGIVPGGFVSLGIGTHTLTLLARDERGAIGTATLTINVSGENTFTGTAQHVVLTDARFVTDEYKPLGSERPIGVTFANVTASGLTWLESRHDATPPPPAGMQAGSPPYYYDLQSTATFTGLVNVCFNIRGMSFARANGELVIHRLDQGVWRALDSHTATGDQVCGDAETLGTFAIFYPQVPETAITTVAGTGVAENAFDGPGGDTRDDFAEDAAATRSTLTRPGRLARDAAGRVYVADNGSPAGARIRRIDTNGLISTAVPEGICDGLLPIAVDANARFLYCVQPNQVTGLQDIIKYDFATLADTIVVSAPEVLAMLLDDAGNLFFSDGRIHRVPAGGGAQLIFQFDNGGGALTLPYSDSAWTLAFDRQRHLLAGGTTLIRISPGADGFVDGSADETVEKVAGISGVDLPGYSQPFGGDGLPAAQAMLTFTDQMIVAEDGAVVFTDQSRRIRRIDPGADHIVNGGEDEIVRTVAGYFAWAPATASGFATSEYGDFRGLIEHPGDPDSFIVSSRSGHKLQRFGIAQSTETGPTADVSVTLTASTLVVGSVTFDVGIGNNGPSAATNVTTTLSVPGGMTLTGATVPTDTDCTTATTSITCVTTTLAAGQQVVLPMTATATAAGTVTATATIAAAENDPQPSNNQATTEIQVVPATVTLNVTETIRVDDGVTVAPAVMLTVAENIQVNDDVPPIPTAADLSIAVNAVPATVDAGATLTYRVTITNNGPLEASGVFMTLPVSPLEVSGATGSSPAGTCIVLPGQVECTAGNLAAGAHVELIVTVTPRRPGPLVATFTVSGGRVDPVSANNVATVTITVVDRVPPTAVVSAPATVPFGTNLTASAAGSSDAGGGSIVRYLWTLVERNVAIETTTPAVVFERDPAEAIPGGTWHIRLVVVDTSGNQSAPAVATVQVIDMRASNDAYTVKQDTTLAAGVSLVTGQLPYPSFEALGNLTSADGVLYFIDDNFEGRLRRSDGTQTGTIPLTPSFGAVGNRASKPVAINGTLYFVGNDTAHGYELWKSDGTVAGTVLVKDIRPGTLWSEPRELTNVNGTLFFIATGAGGGAELWRSDGTAAGTMLVKAFANRWSEEFFLRNVAGTLYFRLPLGGLWKSDGTSDGTVPVHELRVQGWALYSGAPPQFVPWYPSWPVVLERQLVFAADTGGTQWDLWTADDVRGARLLKSMDPAAGYRRWLLDFAVVNGRLYFGVFNQVLPTQADWDACREHFSDGFCFLNLPGMMPATREIWVSDGTPDSTTLVHTSGAVNDGPFLFTGSGGSVFFVANNGRELWKTDGTSAGTVFVESIVVNDFVVLAANTLTDVNGALFFRGHKTPTPSSRGVWKTDGTTAGTVLVKVTGDFEADDFTVVGGAMYFQMAGRHELWIAGPARGVVDNDSIHTAAPTVTAQVVQPVAHGTLAFNPDGTFVYRPSPGFTGTDTFTYSVSDGTLTSAPATVTIDVAPALPWLSVADAAVVEGHSGTTLLTFTITRSGNLGEVSTVDFVVGGGSATPGADYQAPGGTLSFAPGDTSQQVEVPIYGDAADEGNELFFVTLTGAAGATLGRSRAFGTILNDDFESDLGVAVTAAPAPVEAGAALTYQVVISNMGPSPATGISMTMPVDPAIVSSVSATSPVGTCVVPFIALGARLPVTCDAGSLAPGASRTLTVTVTPRSPGQIVSTFSVAAQEIDRVAANNIVSIDTSVTPLRRRVDHGGVWYGALRPDGEEAPVIVQFSAVAVPGILIAEPIPTPPAPPIEYAFVSEVFDITTTASISGLTSVCVAGTGFMPEDRLVHFNGSQWEDVTVPNTPTSGQVCGQSATLSPFAVVRDVTPPRVRCAMPDGQWHAADVQLACTASEAGAGLSNPVDVSFTLATSVAGGVETPAAATGSRIVCDRAGNCATAGPITGNKVDRRAPAVTIIAPAQSATYTFGEKISAGYSCADTGSGLETCAGPVNNTAFVDTSSVGTKTFTVNATDAVGNKSTQSVSYEVTCRYVSLALSPATVAAGEVVTIKAGLRSCSTAPQTIALRFILSAPARPGGCSAVSTTLFTTPSMTLPSGFDQTLSFAQRLPRGLCAGPHSITVSTLVNGRVVETTSATISVTR